MYCRNCRMQIPDHVLYCTACGCPTNMGQTPNKNKSGGKVLAICMAGVAAVALAVMVLLLLGVIPSVKDTKATSGGRKAGGAKVEGVGYDSPEECVEAYIDAVNEGNVDKMFSTFAIESYVDGFDTKADLERVQCFAPFAPMNQCYELSDGNDFDRDVRIQVRMAGLTRGLYTMICLQTVHHNGTAIGLKGQDINNFMNNMRAEDYFNAWRDMKFVEFIAPEAICSAYNNENVRKNMATIANVYGCDELTDVCALVEIRGEKYYQFAECGKYNGKWYIINCHGTLASLMGASLDYWGIVPCSELY